MALFSKKKDNKEPTIPKLPDLPSLPSLPSRFPDMNSSEDNEIPELPSFPTGGVGDKFSRDTIKNAISGDDDDEPIISPEELVPKPAMIPQKPMSMERMKKITPMERPEERAIPKETGPVFIRIDKFEEALNIFKETRKKIEEIESLLGETKEIKQKEEEELSTWEEEIQEMKQQIEKVDRDIFSRI